MAKKSTRENSHSQACQKRARQSAKRASRAKAGGQACAWLVKALEQCRRSRRRSAASRPPIRSRKASCKHINPFTLLVAVVLSAQATDAGVNKATPALFALRRHAAEDGGARRGARARAGQDHRAVPHQGQERGRAVAPARRRAWRAGAALARGAGGAARRRPQDRQCRAQHRLRRADHRGRHAYLPRRQPHRSGARQESARGRG